MPPPPQIGAAPPTDRLPGPDRGSSGLCVGFKSGSITGVAAARWTQVREPKTGADCDPRARSQTSTFPFRASAGPPAPTSILSSFRQTPYGEDAATPSPAVGSAAWGEAAAARGAEVEINHRGRWQIPAGPELSQSLIGSCNSALIWLGRSMPRRRASCADPREKKFPGSLLLAKRRHGKKAGRRAATIPEARVA